MINKHAIFFYVIFFVAYFASPVMADTTSPEPVGKAALVMDAENGQMLFDKNAAERMYPASTTKIMTALLALEKSSLEEMVTITKRAAEIGGTRVGLQPGEQIKMEHLLYILMLSSANDAAVAIAEHVGGSVEEFAVLMNSRAREMKTQDTNFVNPHGMPDENHYTSARDLAKISRQAMQNSKFRQIVQTVNYKVERKKNMEPEVLQQVEKLERIYGSVQEDFYNHNKLLTSTYYGYKNSNGIKTGYTVDAGQCIVASVKRKGREMIAVVLNSQGTNIYTDAAMLLDYGFKNFEPVFLVKPREMITDVVVKYGSENAVLETDGYLYYNFPIGQEPEVTRRVELQNNNINAPLQEGERLGEMVLESGGVELGRVPLATVYPVSRGFFTYWRSWAGIVLAILFVLQLITVQRRRKKHRSRVLYMKKRCR